jgi:hypothetical protein
MNRAPRELGARLAKLAAPEIKVPLRGDYLPGH